MPNQPYHTALKDLAPVDAPELEKPYYCKHGVVFSWSVLSRPIPVAYNDCDVICSDLAWPAGLQIFNDRAGESGLSFSNYMAGVVGVVEALNKPTFLVCSFLALKYLPQADYVTKIKLRGTEVYGWFSGGAVSSGETNFDVARELAQTYKTVGDFCCGYGSYGKIFVEAGGRFVLSDYNKQCCGYVASVAETWGKP